MPIDDEYIELTKVKSSMKNNNYQKKISVIIPCHNIVRDYFCITMKSMIEQTIGIDNIEIILVDDCSDDGNTLNILKEYENNYKEHIKVISLQENLKQGGARNVGMPYASGEYITFCDADDWIAINAYDEIYRLAKLYDSDVVEFDFKHVHKLELSTELNKPTNIRSVKINSVDERKEFIMQGITQPCVNRIYKKDLLLNNNIRFAEHIINEEVPFTYMAFMCADSYVKCNADYYFYFQNSESSTHVRSYEDIIPEVRQSFEIYFEATKSGEFYKDYKNEIDFIFWSGYFLLPLIYKSKMTEFFSKEEFELMQVGVKSRIAQIYSNPYYVKKFGNITVLGALAYIPIQELDLDEIKNALREINL